MLFGDSPLLKLSSDEISCVIDFVKAELGCAFVTKSYVNKELLAGDLIQIKIKDSMPPSRQVYMLINKNKEYSVALNNWLEMINGAT